jgi:kojibiose phosphorylase
VESQGHRDERCTYYNVGDPITVASCASIFATNSAFSPTSPGPLDYFTTAATIHPHRGGAEVILECGALLLLLHVISYERGRYEILDVVGPTSITTLNNNSFTNRLRRDSARRAGHGITCGEASQVLRALHSTS